MTSRPGRPLRALAGFMVVMAMWFAVRAPGLEERYAAGMLAMRRTGIAAASAVAKAIERIPIGVRIPTVVDVVPNQAVTPAQARPHLPHVQETGLHPRADAGKVLRLPPPPAAPFTAAPPAHAELRPSGAGFDLATQAYAQLAAGERRAAERLFGEAIAAGDNPNLEAWSRERRRLNRRWSGDAYTLFRDASLAEGAAASPVLGGGQSGGSIAWGIDPLARQPLAIIGRIYAAHDAKARIDGNTTQAAVGVRWQPVHGVSIAAERLIALGKFTSADWNLRVAAGVERRVGRVVFDGYGEAGVRGNGDVYAGGQARAAVPLGAAAGVAFSAGPGVWGSIQSAATTVSRVDLGIGVNGRLPAGVAASADWRWRIAGNAAPVSGPAVTVSVAF